MTVVVDSSILIAFGFLDEPLHGKANALLAAWENSSEILTAPRLFRSEITAVIRKAVYQRRTTLTQGRALLTQLLMYTVEFHEAYEIAHRFNRPRAYDTQYMALAERLNCEFWTADERLFNSVQSQFSHIRWLATWPT